MKIGIVGAGIMGRLLALTFVNAGHDITIFDEQDDKDKVSCSMAAAGMLAPITELERCDKVIYQLGNAALNQHWPVIIKQLNTKIYFKHTGSLAVSHPQDKPDLMRFANRIQSKLNEMANENSYCKKLNQAEIMQLEPEISKFDEAYFFPEEGQIDNQSLLMELRCYLSKRQVEWHHSTFVEEVYPGKIITKKGDEHFDMVFDCRGMGAKSSFKDLHSVRGELIWLHAKDVNIKRPIRFLHPRYALYIIPRLNHTYLVGASEIHSETTEEISVRTTLELLTAAFYLHPGFAEAKIIKTVTQCRPTFPDCLPKIKYTNGLMAVNGLYRHGFLIAPTLADEMMRKVNQSESLQYPQLWESL